MLRFVPLAVCFLSACKTQLPPPVCATPGPAVRRLSRPELDATFSDALQSPVALSDSLSAEDTRLGYVAHDGLQVTPLFADQLDGATFALAQTQAAASTCNAGEAERDCASRVLAALVPRLWRRPLADSELDELLALYDAGRDGEDHATGLALAMQGAFEASGTLYRTELGDGDGRLTPYEIASELSYLATGAPPDGPLLDAAARGELLEAGGRVEQLRRLLWTPQAVVHLRDFVEQWFGLIHMEEVQKNNHYLPDFNLALRDDMALSARHFIEAVLSGRGRVSELLFADYTYADDALAAFLGSAQRPGPQLQRLSTADLPRRGLVTHPALLAVYGHNDDGSPVLRGKLVRTRLFCQELPPPPPGVVAVVPPVSTTATTRGRATAHLTDASCRACHQLMDPIGFGLEGFDGFGEARTMEAGQPIDDSGEIIESDVPGPFRGGVELAARLNASQQVGRCANVQLTRFAMGRAETDADQCMLDLAQQRYRESDGTLFSALEGVVASDAFVKRAVTP
jgi:hypothetical protein